MFSLLGHHNSFGETWNMSTIKAQCTLWILYNLIFLNVCNMGKIVHINRAAAMLPSSVRTAPPAVMLSF